MKRASSIEDVTAPLVEPTSVTVVCAPLAASTSATSAGSSVTGAATTARSAPATASSSDAAGTTALRSPATPSAPASTSQPRTFSTPAARAASPTDAPIRPVPTTASRRTATLGGAHQLGHAEREVERLACVQSRVAERHVAGIELRLLHILGTAEALGHVVARELEMDAAGPRPGLPVRGEEALDLAEHRVEVTRLAPGPAREDIRVHGVAGPDDGMACIADST